MPKRLLTLAFIGSLTLGAAAQTPQQPPTAAPPAQQPPTAPPPTQRPPTPRGQQPSQTVPATVEPPITPPRPAAESSGQPVNVRLDLTITDQTGPGEPTRKTVTMLLSDRQSGSIRSRGQVRVAGRGWENVTINVDARPVILREGSIRVEFGLEYQPRGAGDTPPPAGGTGPTIPPLEPASSNLNQRLSVILDSGKPLVISQAADPASDRRISVELKATVMK